jgi:hypothetical protein
MQTIDEVRVRLFVILAAPNAAERSKISIPALQRT